MEEERNKEPNSYRSILKGTSIFGSVQVFQIGINLIRGKFVAMFLGPTGMGISSLFNTSGLTLQKLAGLGLNLSIVKEVAGGRDNGELGAVMATARRLLLYSALLGALLCIALAMPLSRLTFGSDDYYWQFMALGAMIFFGVAGQGYFAMLQGLHAVKLISATTIIGALTGLLTGVPLYYFLGDKGIVPAMILLALSTFVASWIGVGKAVKMPKVKFDRLVHTPIARRLLLTGVVFIASDLIGTGCNYLVNLFIRTFGELENVGLFQAANSVTNQYSGVVFAAMMLDFFPRLSAASKDNVKVSRIVNRQFEIVALIATPLICLLILTSPLIISILLTDEFMSITPLMRWLGMGVLIKALMFPLGYIALAKDNRRLYFWMEGITLNLLTLGLSCAGYYLFGLIGLGYSLIIDCSICLVVYYFVNRRLYGFSFTWSSVYEGGMAILTGACCFAFSFFENPWASYTLMGAVTAAAIIRSALILKRKIR